MRDIAAMQTPTDMSPFLLVGIGEMKSLRRNYCGSSYHHRYCGYKLASNRLPLDVTRQQNSPEFRSQLDGKTPVQWH